MEKKAYITPETQVVAIKIEQLMGLTVSGTDKITSSEEDNGVVQRSRRRRNQWDEEEEEDW